MLDYQQEAGFGLFKSCWQCITTSCPSNPNYFHNAPPLCKTRFATTRSAGLRPGVFGKPTIARRVEQAPQFCRGLSASVALSFSPALLAFFIPHNRNGKAVAQRAGGEKQLSITATGAVGDGVTLNTAAIQKAIDTLATNRGGTLVIPPG